MMALDRSFIAGEFAYWQDMLADVVEQSGDADEWDVDNSMEVVLDRARDAVLMELQSAMEFAKREIVEQLETEDENADDTDDF